MAESRPVRYELHIRPMFRRKDRDRMIWAFDLWDYDDVVANSANIRTRLADMPPEDHGGIWPQEWIDLFQRWIDEGHPRLEKGTATYTAEQDGQIVTVVANGTFSQEGSRVWLQRAEANQSDTELEFELFIEPPVQPSGNPGSDFSAEEKLRVSGTVTTITVYDASGATVINLP